MRQDAASRDFYANPERYADLINGVACGGDPVVRAEDLQELDTRAGKSTKGRDLVRRVAFGVNFAVVGIENQEHVDYEFPLRNMIYEAEAYERQAKAIRNAVRGEPRGLRAGEYLYGFKKGSRLQPVVTLAVYYGIEPWDGPGNLHEMLGFADIPERIRTLVQNFTVHVVDVRRMQDTSVFRTDVRQVFDFIRCCENPEQLKALVQNDPAYQSLEEDAFDLMMLYSKSGYLVKKKDYLRKDGKVDMCRGLVEWARQEREAGEASGIVQGADQEKEATMRAALKMNLPIAQIAQLCRCSEERVMAFQERQVL